MGFAGGGQLSVPVPFYVIEHPDGVALFDCGLHANIADPDDGFRKILQRQGMDVSFDAEDIVTRHLERLDIDPARVRYVVLSHLHFDHAGGLHQIPNATVVAQKAEWEAGLDPERGPHLGLARRFFDLGHEVLLIDGEHDVFGDGAVTCLPSPGHTPGHQSVRVRSAQGDHILLSDACYAAEIVRTRKFPAFSDAAAMNASLDRLMALRDAETVMVFGHDKNQWEDGAVLSSLRD